MDEYEKLFDHDDFFVEDTIPDEGDGVSDEPDGFDAALAGDDAPDRAPHDEAGERPRADADGDSSGSAREGAAAGHTKDGGAEHPARGEDTIPYKFNHEVRPLERRAVQSIADALGLDADGVVTALQKGAGYDRLQQRYESLAGGAPREWVEFFLQNPDVGVEDLPAEVLEGVRSGGSITEALLRHRLAEAERRLDAERREWETRGRAMGSVSGEVGEEVADPGVEAFESAFR